jgi:hypothetical protein
MRVAVALTPSLADILKELLHLPKNKLAVSSSKSRNDHLFVVYLDQI